MKIITDKKTLSAVMKKAAKVASARTALPILSHVAIDFDGETCTITANDSARTYSERFAATGEPGQCTMEADKLLKAVNGMASGDLELTDGQVKQGRSKIKLESRNYGDFPQPDYENAQDCGITGEQLASMIAVIGHAVPTKDVRPMLNGIHLTEGHCVATDGHRMAWADCDYAGPDIIIPAETVRQIGDMTGKVMVSDKQLIIESESARFTTNLLSEKYPNWKGIIPREFVATATMNADDFVAAMKTAQIGGDNAKLDFSGGQCHISNKGAESACDAECDADMVVGLFIQYAIDAIQASGLEAVTIGLNQSRPGCLINERFTVMPVRL